MRESRLEDQNTLPGGLLYLFYGVRCSVRMEFTYRERDARDKNFSCKDLDRRVTYALTIYDDVARRDKMRAIVEEQNRLFLELKSGEVFALYTGAGTGLFRHTIAYGGQPAEYMENLKVLGTSLLGENRAESKNALRR